MFILSGDIDRWRQLEMGGMHTLVLPVRLQGVLHALERDVALLGRASLEPADGLVPPGDMRPACAP